jgi:hypothetical protein
MEINTATNHTAKQTGTRPQNSRPETVMNSLRLLFAVGSGILLASCAMSTATSFTDPAASGKRYLSPIMVASNLPLGDRAPAEQKMIDAVQKKSGRQALSGMQVFPPTRKWDAAALDAALADSEADAIVIMWVTDMGTTQTYVPPRVLWGGSASTHGMMTNRGGGNYSFDYNTLYTPPTVTDGYKFDKPNAQYGAALYDAETGQKIWISEISSRGSAFASYADLAKSAASRIVKDLYGAGHL